MMTHKKAVLLMVLVTLLWSTAGVVTRHLEAARSFEVTFWRSFFAGVAVLMVLLAKGAKAGAGPLQARQGGWRRLMDTLRTATPVFWVSSVCWCGMFTFFMLAIMLTSVANVLVTLALGPLITALMARLWIGHRLALRTWVAIGVAGAGMAYMYADQVASGQWGGTLLALCVPLAGALNWTLTQRAHAHGDNVDLAPAVMVGGLLSAAITLPLAWPLQSTGHDVALLAFLGLTQLAVPCLLVVVCAKYLPAPELALLALLEVIFGILLAWVGAGEVPSQSVLLGGTLVIAALAGNEILGWKQKNH